MSSVETSSTVEQRVTAIIVNYRTPELLVLAVESFRIFYPRMPLVLVDNGSDVQTVHVVQNLVERDSTVVSGIYLNENIFHGPAMHRAIAAVKTPYVFILDSDTETLQGGFIELMLAKFESDEAYAVGESVRVTKRGFVSASGKITVPISAYLLLDKLKYGKLPPFIHHGLPLLNNFAAAQKRGWTVEDFPIDTYVKHLGRGTVKKFGYGLGLKSRIDFFLNRLGL